MTFWRHLAASAATQGCALVRPPGSTLTQMPPSADLFVRLCRMPHPLLVFKAKLKAAVVVARRARGVRGVEARCGLSVGRPVDNWVVSCVRRAASATGAFVHGCPPSYPAGCQLIVHNESAGCTIAIKRGAQTEARCADYPALRAAFPFPAKNVGPRQAACAG